MYPRLLQTPQKQSFFLFGPRGVGKTAWLHQQLPGALFFDLLDHQIYAQLLAAPERLGERIPLLCRLFLVAIRRWIILSRYTVEGRL
jgi:hypothetical protein